MNSHDGPILPQQWKVIDGSILKLLAVVTMVIDHTASILLRDVYITLFTIGSRSFDLYDVMRMIGRVSFPIYAFLLVEGFLHTRNVKRYIGNLLFFAVLSEIPWNIAHSGRFFLGSQNVMFTLVLGLLGLCVIRYCQENRKQQCVLLLGLLALSILMRADYGCSGFGFILMLYLLRDQKLYRCIVGCCFLSSRWMAGMAFIPISLYNGKRGFIQGKVAKYAFYLVYPVHFLLLYWIRRQTIGY